MIGRKAEAARILDLLQSSERAVAVVGPAGIGKSTLASYATERWEAGPAYRVEVQSPCTSERLVSAMAHTLGCPVDALHGVMAKGRHVLVMLDGLSDPSGGIYALLEGWLDTNDTLRILMTSRRRPSWRGARVLELGALSEEAAIALFEARARSAQPDLKLPTTSNSTLKEVVSKLDRVPEAIELAAQRMQVMSLDALDARLAKPRIAVGAGSDPRGPMRKAFDEAWKLIDEVGQTVLATCALFVGEFDAESVEEIALLPTDGPSVPTVLVTLQEHSLVSTRVRGGRVSFWMLDTIRRFALGRLDESGRRAEVEGRFVAWAMQRSDALLSSSPGPSRDEKLDASWDNLDAAAQLALERDLTACLKVLTAMCLVAGKRRPIAQLAERVVDAWTWVDDSVAPDVQAELLIQSATLMTRHGNVHRLSQSLDAVLRQVELNPSLRVRLHVRRGELAFSQGVDQQVESDLKDARRYISPPSARQQEAQPLLLEACVALRAGRLRTAQERAMDCFMVAQDCGLETLAARAALTLADVAHRASRYEDARGQLALAREHFQRSGDRGGLSWVDCAAGALQLEQPGGQVVARGLLEASLNTSREFGDLDTAGRAHGYLGLLAVELNEHEPADQHFGGAAYAHRRTSRLGAALVVGQMGILELKRGRSAIAERRLTDCCRAFSALRSPFELSLFNTYRALTLLVRGDVPAALRALDAHRPMPEFVVPCAVATYVRHLAEGGQQAPDPTTQGLHGRLIRHLSASAGLASQASRLVLHLERQGRWFRVGAQDTTELGHRKPMRRIILELANRRVQAPGVGMSTEAIFEAGWPDERASEESAKNRVYVTIRRLRSGGLGAVLVNDDTGYFLDPNVTIAWAPG